MINKTSKFFYYISLCICISMFSGCSSRQVSIQDPSMVDEIVEDKMIGEEEFDTQSVDVVDDHIQKKYQYVVTDEGVVFSHLTSEGIISNSVNMQDVDTLTFEELDRGEGAWSKDNLYYYYKGLQVAGITTDGEIKMFSETMYMENGGKIYSLESVTEYGGEGFMGASTQKIVSYTLKEHPEIDSQTFEIVKSGEKNNSYDICKDKNSIYSCIIPGKTIDIVSNPESLMYIGSDGWTTYFKDKNNIYHGNPDGLKILEGLSPDTFQMLGRGYLKDDKTIFYQTIPATFSVDDVDVATFQVGVPKYDDKLTFYSGGGSFALDKNNVFYANNKISASPHDFDLITDYCGRDDTYMYCNGEKIAVDDVASIVPVYENFQDTEGSDQLVFWKDSFSVYHPTTLYKLCEKDNDDYQNAMSCIGPSMDPNTVQALSPNYIKDNNLVAYLTSDSYRGADLNIFIEGADPDTFELYTDTGHYGQVNYAKDKDYIYYNKFKITGYDKSSFKKIGRSYIVDKNGVYHGEFSIERAPMEDNNRINPYVFQLNDTHTKIEGADPQTFELILQNNDYPTNYAKDKNNVYEHGSIIPNADPNNFDPQNPYGIPTKKVTAEDLDSCVSKITFVDANNKEQTACCDEIVEGEGREQISDIYAKTDTQAYTMVMYPKSVPSCELIEVDVDSFEAFDHEIISTQGERESILKKTFSYSLQDTGFASTKAYGVYSMDKDTVYFSLPYQDSTESCEYMDSGDYGFDVCSPILGAYPLPGADRASFEILDHRYSKDKNSVYFGNRKLEGADPSSFRIYERDLGKNADYVVFDDLGLDDTYVYKRGQKIEGVSSDGFEYYNQNVYKDRLNGVYILYEGVRTTIDADYESFTYDFDNILWKDKDTVYNISRDFDQMTRGYNMNVQVIPGRDPAYIQLVSCTENDKYCYKEYMKDKDFVYMRHNHEVIEGADPDTFTYTDANAYAKDKNAVYSKQYKLDLDVNKAVEFPGNTANGGTQLISDGKNIYSGYKKVSKLGLIDMFGSNYHGTDEQKQWLIDMGHNLDILDIPKEDIVKKMKEALQKMFDNSGVCKSNSIVLMRKREFDEKTRYDGVRLEELGEKYDELYGYMNGYHILNGTRYDYNCDENQI